MKLDPPYSATGEADCGSPFQLAPASRTKLLSQPRNLANRTAGGNSFDFRDFADDFKVHRPASCPALSEDLSQTHNAGLPPLRAKSIKFNRSKGTQKVHNRAVGCKNLFGGAWPQCLRLSLFFPVVIALSARIVFDHIVKPSYEGLCYYRVVEHYGVLNILHS